MAPATLAALSDELLKSEGSAQACRFRRSVGSVNCQSGRPPTLLRQNRVFPCVRDVLVSAGRSPSRSSCYIQASESLPWSHDPVSTRAALRISANLVMQTAHCHRHAPLSGDSNRLRVAKNYVLACSYSGTQGCAAQLARCRMPSSGRYQTFWHSWSFPCRKRPSK